MNSKVKSSIHFSIIMYFIIYFISTLYESNFWGDVLSPIGTIITFVILLYVFKKSTRMSSIWLILSMSALSWAIADVAWAICELIFEIDPENISMFNVLYLMPNIFILASGSIFFGKIIKKLNGIQLLLDAIAISVSVITLFWILYMHNSFNIFIESIDNVILFLYVISDFIMISSVAIFILSIRKGKIPSGIYLTFFAAVFYSVIDLLYSYVYFYDLYVPNSIIDSGYIFAYLLFAYGGLLVLKQQDNIQVNKFYIEFENSGINRNGLLLLIFPAIFIIFRGFQYTELILFILIYILYEALSLYVQNAIKNEKLLIKEKDINLTLEEKVAERTKELLIKNKELEYISNHDFITNMYNGRYFKDALDDLLKIKDNNNKITLFYIDLDRFKTINDTYGHDVGDQVLIEISKRLAMTNNDDNILARLGGDEFIILIKGSYSIHEIENIINDMIKFCNEPIYIDNYQFRVTLSVGVTTFPKDGETRSALMKNADIAMYCSKSKG